MPKITVMIIGLNVEKYIREAIDSVLAQTYTDYEIVFVDDGSTDNTAEIVKSYGDKVRYFHQTNQGIPRARNHGLKHSRGEYVALLDGDDCFQPDKLARQVAVLDAHPGSSFACTDMLVMDESGKVYTTWERRNCPATFEQLYQGNMLWVPTAMIRRSVLEAINGWDEELLVSQDYDLWLRLARQAPFCYLDEPLTRYRNRPGSMGKRTAGRLKDNIKLLRKKEIAGDKTLLEKQIRAAKGYCYFAELFLEEQNFWMAGKCYLKAVLNYPLIGILYWPPETKHFRFSWVYRVLKFPVKAGYFLVKGLLKQRG